MRIFKLLAGVFFTLAFILSISNCEQIDLQNVSDYIEYDGDFSIPLIKTTMDAQGFFDVFYSGDSISVDDYDSIKTLVKNDSLFYFYFQTFLTEFQTVLTMNDTLDLSLNESIDNVNIDYVYLYFNSKNGLPIEIAITSYLYDSASNTIFDTLDFGILPAAPVDDSGKVIANLVQPHLSVISISQETLEHFFNNSDKLILHGDVKNPNTDSLFVYVEVLKKYTIDFQFALEGSGKLRTHIGGN